MNNILTSPIGIDSVIQNLQSSLYYSLASKWSGDIDAYGRIYKNIDSDSNNYVPQWWNNNTLDYDDVRYNDNVSCTFGFIDSDKHDSEDGEIFTADVKCVFMVNLNEILPSYIERADAKAQMDILNLLQDISYFGFEIKGVEKGLKNVFNGFDISKILNTDMQPKHCFSINIKLSYYLKCN